MTDASFERCWAIVELFGHQKIAGEVSEEALAGGSFLRVDVPAEGDYVAFTRFYGASAVYSITPVSEEVARLACRQIAPKPMTIWVPELQRIAPPEVEIVDSERGEEGENGIRF